MNENEVQIREQAIQLASEDWDKLEAYQQILFSNEFDVDEHNRISRQRIKEIVYDVYKYF